MDNNSLLTGEEAYILVKKLITPETDPTVPSWAKQPNKPSYTADEVGAATMEQVNDAIADAIGDAIGGSY